jgi:ATP-binding cassette subfamily C protein
MTQQSGSGEVRAQLASYLVSFAKLGRYRLAGALALVVVGTVADGIGILLLIPLLSLIFTDTPGTGASGRFGAEIHAALTSFSPNGQLIALLSLFAGLLLIRAIVSWQRDLRLIALSMTLVDSWRERIVRSVAGASWRRLQELQDSRLEFAVNSEVGRLAVGGDRVMRGGVAAVQLVLLLAVALLLSPVLTLLALLCSLAGLPLLLPLVRNAHGHGEELSRDGGKRQNVFSEFLAGMKLAKVHDAEQRYAAEFIALSDLMRQRVLAFAGAQLRNHNAFQLAGGIAAALIVFVGIAWLHISPVVLSALLVLLTRVIGPVQQIAQSVQTILTMLPAVGNLTRIEASLAADPVPHDEVTPSSVATGPMAVVLKSIDYKPPGRGQSLLQGLDCTISPGSLVVLLGPSGSGKTTLADILLGLVEPDRGEIEADGVPIRTAAARSETCRRVGYVPQESFLFDQSLRQNLLWAKPDAAEDELWAALAHAEASDFVRRLPDGLETRVGNRGSNLSGGERQRICLARALLRRPGLLILDEATSALDPAVEERLIQTLVRLRGQMTLLMIAHRLPAWLSPDATFTLVDGVLETRARPLAVAAKAELGA